MKEWVQEDKIVGIRLTRNTGCAALIIYDSQGKKELFISPKVIYIYFYTKTGFDLIFSNYIVKRISYILFVCTYIYHTVVDLTNPCPYY